MRLINNMKYKCKKCGELYDEMPYECDYDCETEFLEVELCECCNEYKELHGSYCLDCIRENFSEKIGHKYIKYLDEKLKGWGLEPFFKTEYEYFYKLEREKENFLWEYCTREPEALGEFIFDIYKKQDYKICSEN